ncbi:hypothetical protein Lal_00014304 [Lupinus albus]|nr:hypothetical protein Lal_00014304 [Lupinus albus]
MAATIAITDDDAVTRETLKSYLTDEGFDVLLARRSAGGGVGGRGAARHPAAAPGWADLDPRAARGVGDRHHPGQQPGGEAGPHHRAGDGGRRLHREALRAARDPGPGAEPAAPAEGAGRPARRPQALLLRLDAVARPHAPDRPAGQPGAADRRGVRAAVDLRLQPRPGDEPRLSADSDDATQDGRHRPHHRQPGPPPAPPDRDRSGGPEADRHRPRHGLPVRRRCDAGWVRSSSNRPGSPLPPGRGLG